MTPQEICPAHFALHACMHALPCSMNLHDSEDSPELDFLSQDSAIPIEPNQDSYSLVGHARRAPRRRKRARAARASERGVTVTPMLSLAVSPPRDKIR